MSKLAGGVGMGNVVGLVKGAVRETMVGVKAEDRADKLVDGKKVLQDKIDAMTNGELVDYLEGSHKSDVYIVLNHFLTAERKGKVKKQPLYRERFKEIERLAEESYKHDNRSATNLEVDKVATYLYQTFLKMLRVQQDEINSLTARLDKLDGGVKIEEVKVGVEIEGTEK